MAERQHPWSADDLEAMFRAALQAGDAKGVEAALLLMAPMDPHRADYLLECLKLGLDLARTGRG